MPANRFFATLALATLIVAPMEAQAWDPLGLWSKKETPQQKQAQHPVRQASAEVPVARPAASLELTQTAGPWLILATTFSGEGAEDQARDLCYELRQTLRLPTYLHKMSFDLASEERPVGRGVDRYGAPIKMRYRSGTKRSEWAVLVGDYPAVDDSLAEKDLARVKSIQPAALDISQSGATRQNLANLRAYTAALSGKQSGTGPMRAAFLTRNPLLPEEYFVPQGVDKFVEKMNKGVDNSALNIPGRYSVKVATFRARGTLLGASQARSSRTRRGKKDDDALAEAAWKANRLCEEMRRRGWDAYEFHDRTESSVMVGSYDRVKRADGTPDPEVMEIIRTFGAAYDTPATPLAWQRVPDASAQRQQRQEVFTNLFSSEVGQVAGGMTPKYAHVQLSDDKRAPLAAVPFDIHPHVVNTPKRSISKGFSWGR